MIRTIELFRAECGLCGKRHVLSDTPSGAEAAARRSGWQVDGAEIQCPECNAALDNLEDGAAEGRWSLVDAPAWSAVCREQTVSTLHGPADLLRLLRQVERDAERVGAVCCGG